LYDMSDHLPVVMNLEIDSNFLASQQFQLNNSVSFLEGNLVSERLQLQFNDGVIGKELRIYNQLGQLVKLHTIESNIESLDIESFNNGFFFLQIEHLDGALKFIKNQ
ncbi:MAG: T9SS type A sorting domain-containing protein, partial [Psychroflexus salarius]